ncbi:MULTISPECIES: universal stress protein [Halorussus]|uniref:universal stress protein n=1 Tax=Halorussus TaxID=1070314 RepID=UPI00209E777B|nr:universal stress protein [Halorussus vallis]USZ76039.1 universal stress protein [Halorussus vallis]
MAFRILVPMDRSKMAEKALEYALETHPDAAVTVLHVVGVPSAFMGEAASLALDDDIETAAEAHAEDVFDRAREIAADRGVEIATVVDVGKPAKAIVSRAADFDAVVIGSHGSDLLERILIGNVAETVVRRSPVPVTVVR